MPVGVVIELSGFGHKAGRIAVEVEPVINLAVIQVRKKLVQRGVSTPYMLYWNGRFVGGDKSRGWVDEVADGDVFRVIPVVSGG